MQLTKIRASPPRLNISARHPATNLTVTDKVIGGIAPRLPHLLPLARAATIKPAEIATNDAVALGHVIGPRASAAIHGAVAVETIEVGGEVERGIGVIAERGTVGA